MTSNPRRTGEHRPEDDGQGPTTRQPQPLHGRPDRRGLARALREPEARSTPMARTCSKGPRSLSIVSILSLPRRRSDRCESASPSRTSVDLPDYNHRPLVCTLRAPRPLASVRVRDLGKPSAAIAAGPSPSAPVAVGVAVRLSGSYTTAGSLRPRSTHHEFGAVSWPACPWPSSNCRRGSSTSAVACRLGCSGLPARLGSSMLVARSRHCSSCSLLEWRSIHAISAAICRAACQSSGIS
jgi:hypothetical protein